ncbi:lysozyme inhibitor LprI family protein [Stenotrophomonas sp.]|uniref:lysozyme inhibitor LprI family protein n=1 Tax=Stenotrophomonas sp. TaxID=69392 RepID=UPI0028AF7FA7|nr:lysozyme inhibitor LprI family protein [Stenotrophomonas sp.]
MIAAQNGYPTSEVCRSWPATRKEKRTMHVVNPISGLRRGLYRNGRWSILALSLALAACQAPSSEAVTLGGPVAASSPDAQASAPAAAVQPAATAAEAPSAQTGKHELSAADLAMEAEDMGPRTPDESYRKANLRPKYIACVKASNAVTRALQACGDEEFAWQDRRLVAAVSKIADGPDGKVKDDLMDEQAAYMSDTNRYCSANPDEDGQGQMLDAQSCRINRTANRADQLEALISK